MEHYSKGEAKEIDDPCPFGLEDVIQMRVTPGSKVRNMMGFAMKKITEKEVRQIIWNGLGLSVTKTITCAEIMKRKVKGLHQITKIKFKRVEEHWTPKVEGLEPLKVNRDIPAISILLSKDPLDSSEPGYQAPGNFESFWQKKRSSDKTERSRPRSWRKPSGAPDPEQSGHRFKKPKKWQGTNVNKEASMEHSQALPGKSESVSSPEDVSSKDMS